MVLERPWHWLLQGFGTAPSLERERTNAHVARLIRERRIQAKLTQADLAKLIGTAESVISRLEDADCEGHSLTMQPPARGASE